VTSAPALRPHDAPALLWLARLPFLSAHDLAIVLDVADHSGVHRRLRRLAQQGLVAHVVPSSEDLQPQWYYYLTNAGVFQAAGLAGRDPATFAHHWRLTDAGLLRRLVRLEHLVSSRGFLLDLLADVRAQNEPGLALHTWQVWPLQWSYRWRDTQHPLPLDGAAALSRPTAQGLRWSSFVLLYDGAAHVSTDALRSRLRALLRAVRASWWHYLATGAAFPTVLLITQGAARGQDLRALAAEIAHDEGTSVPDLRTADAAALDLATPLEALWQDAWGHERPLLAALPLHAQPVPELLGSARSPGSADDSQEDDDAEPPRTRILVQGDLTARAAQATVPRTAGERALVSLALRPREVRTLQQIATQPLLLAAHLAELTDASALGISRTLTTLERHGLIAWDLPTLHEAHTNRRYFCTPTGLHLLAARVGLSPALYADQTGSVAGELVARATTLQNTGPFPRKGRLAGTRLVWLQRYLEHTVGLQEVYLAFVRAAQAHTDHALDLWRGEWALAHHFEYSGVWHTLRPDAAGVYRAGSETLSFYLEYDRGTAVLGDVYEKLDTYRAYRASGLYTRDRALCPLHFPTLLFLTTGEERLYNILDLADELAHATLTRPLLMRAATVADLAQHGPLATIWRSMTTNPAAPLLAAGAPG